MKSQILLAEMELKERSAFTVHLTVTIGEHYFSFDLLISKNCFGKNWSSNKFVRAA